MRRGTVRADDDTSYLDKRIRRISNRLEAVEAGRSNDGQSVDDQRLASLEDRLDRLETQRLELAQRMQGQLLSIKGEIKRLKEAQEVHQSEISGLLDRVNAIEEPLS